MSDPSDTSPNLYADDTERLRFGVGVSPRHIRDPNDRELNARELRFVEAYVCGDDRSVGNAYRSAIVAGYPHSTSQAWAHRWVLDPRKYPHPSSQASKQHIYDAIQRRRAEIAERTNISEAAVVGEIRKVAMFNMGNILKVTSAGDPYVDLANVTIDDLAAISETQMEDFLDGRGEDAREVRRVKVKTHDKIAALDKLARILGLYKPDRVIHSNDPDNPFQFGHDLAKLSEDELEVYMQLVRKMEGKETEEDRLQPIMKAGKLIDNTPIQNSASHVSPLVLTTDEVRVEVSPVAEDPEAGGIEGAPVDGEEPGLINDTDDSP